MPAGELVGGVLCINFCSLVAVAALGVLPGCSSFKSQWADRYGPDPILSQTTTSDAALANLMSSQFCANGYARDGYSNDLPLTPAAWYGVILTGFNTVDDACQTYINDLWKIDREKNRVKDVISASAAATAGIVGANANPSAKTLTTLAQAFGLASALTGSIGDSYLFAQDPASVGQIVKKLQVAYRNDLAKNIATPKLPNQFLCGGILSHARIFIALLAADDLSAGPGFDRES